MFALGPDGDEAADRGVMCVIPMGTSSGSAKG